MVVFTSVEKVNKVSNKETFARDCSSQCPERYCPIYITNCASFQTFNFREFTVAIITISRGSYSRGKEVAEALAQRLGYECVSRDILLETCEEFSIPEIRLVKALHDAPSILERFGHGKERYISYFRAAFLNHMAKDNVVYHGLAGHFFLQDISHVFKVRIIAKMDDQGKRRDETGKLFRGRSPVHVEKR